MISRTLAEIASHRALIPAMVSAGLLIFLAFFIGMLIWVSRRERGPLYRAMSSIPLEGDTEMNIRREVEP